MKLSDDDIQIGAILILDFLLKSNKEFYFFNTVL